MKNHAYKTKELMQIVKERCKSLGVTQEQLAKKVKVSLPTVKRWFSGQGIDLENLFKLLDILSVSLEEIASSLPQIQSKTFTYTEEQEEFFSVNPEYLAYFDQLLQGKSPQQIQKSYQISVRSTRRYLKALEVLKLIEVHPQEKIKFLVVGEPEWRHNGKLALSMRENAFQEFMKTSKQKPGDIKLLIHRYSAEDCEELKQDMFNLIRKAQSFHKRTSLLGTTSKPYGCMLGLAPFTWNLLETVIEL